MDGNEQVAPAERDQSRGIDVPVDAHVHGSPARSSQLLELRQVTSPAGEQDGIWETDLGGRHRASRSRGNELLRRHGVRFASFSVIGGGIFVAGLLLQAVLTSGFHVPSLVSYILQAVISVEASYFLNRWFTWKGTRTPLWSSFLKYNLQKAITVTANLILYGVLLRLGVEYLLDNVLLTAIFTFVNYIGADRFVFLRGTRQIVAAATEPLPHIAAPVSVLEPTPRTRHPLPESPTVSVVIPVRSNAATIRAAIDSILAQDYPLLREVILIGSPEDPTWSALTDLDDPRLVIMETKAPPGIRDANFKRDVGIKQTTGDLVSLVDSDMVLPKDWMSTGVRLLRENDVDCVAGVMRSIRDNFWGRFVDRNRLGAKTPRAESAYLVTAEGFGAAGFKPPITANIVFTRKMYEDCPIDSSWTHGSLEDYEWFWRVAGRGHQVLVSNRLYGWHHHRSGLKSLAREYRRSARGCAFFIRAHRDSPFAQKRMAQAIVLPLAAFAFVIGIAAAAYVQHGKVVVASLAAVVFTGMGFLSAREFARSRTLESLAYPIPALALGLNYTASLAAHLIRNAPVRSTPVLYSYTEPVNAVSVPRRRLRLPLIVILCVQTACSLSLVWSNSAFSDEADYLWIGRLLLDHWVHGATWPSQYAEHVLSGSPYIYPPIGAIANGLGGLAGARILSLVFMLGATALLYSIAMTLFDRLVAVFASALWALSEPVIKLAFATYDPLSIFLAALSAWLVVQAAFRRHRGEFVALAAVALGLSNATAYSGVVIDPVVFAFAYLVWRVWIGKREAWMFSSWMLAAGALVFCAVMTIGRSWPGIMFTVFARSLADHQALLLIASDVWAYSGFVMVLAVAAVAIAYGTRQDLGGKFALLALLGLSIFVVPVAQLHEQTATSMDKHLAYGIWFAAIAGGYFAASFVRSAEAKLIRPTAVAACVLALAYPAITAWQSAWLNFHGWANANSFVVALRSVVAHEPGQYYASGGTHIAEYYTPQGNQWTRWTAGGLPLLASTNVPQTVWNQELRSSNYRMFALFYPTSFSAPKISGSLLLSGNSTTTSRALLQLAGANASEPGLPNLTEALEGDSAYKLVAVGPYDSRSLSEIYAIWEKVTP